MEKAFFRDAWLIVVKADFDQRMTVPILDLKRWTERVSAKTHSGSRPNSDYIPGAGVLPGWNLTRTGRFVQTYATRAFHKGSVVKVLGVENQPRRPSDPNTGKNYDANMLMLHAYEADGGLVECPTGVINRASSCWNTTESGIRIVKLILCADGRLCND